MAKRRLRMFIGPKQNPMASITIPGRSRKEVAAKAEQFVKEHLKNVSMGFIDARGFHPIRASKDYVPWRAGEFPKKGKSKAQRAASEKRGRARAAGSRARRGGHVS